MNGVGEIGGAVRAELGQYLAAHFPARDPNDAPADVPLVLLPVRLETRYAADGQLQVRIYPDEIHLERLDEGLSDDERTAGLAYWTQLWTGGSAVETEAWQTLVQVIRPERTSYVAYALTPTNLDQRPPDPGAADPAPSFPPTVGPTTSGAVARALPDRFLVLAAQGGSTSVATGNPIPAELTVGLPRAGGDADLIMTNSGVQVGAGMEWMVDFDKAKEVGMAVTMPLAQPGQRVDRLLVMGLRSNLDPQASAGEMTALLRSHRFTRGLSFLPPGTPTNNTETDRTDWQRTPTPRPIPTRPPAPLGPETNAARLASALGIDPADLSALEHSADADDRQAQATNTALWSPSWGTFLSTLIVVTPTGASLDDDRRERARDLFQDHVRGRGPLPALRVADQPYGVLPTSSVDRRWQPVPGDPLEVSLTPLLRRIRTIWRASLPNVPRLGQGALDDALLEILGSSPLLEGLRVRSIATQTYCRTGVVAIPDFSSDNGVAQELLDRMIWATLGFSPDSISLGRSLSAVTRPVGLPLVHEHDPAFIEALLSDGPRTVESVLQALLELAQDQAQRALSATSPAELVGTLLDRAGVLAVGLRGQIAPLAAGGVGGRPPTELHGLADQVQAVSGPSGPSLLLEHQPVAAVRGSLAEVALQPQLAEAAAQRIALQTIGAWLRASARYAEWGDALVILKETTLEQRGYLVAEALDLASHRLDAWITALPARRLTDLRGRQATGVVIGAYGWVENLAPGSEALRDGGWIHAPSVTHAATAGVLRSGYLTHNPGAAGDGALAVDLRSERVRTAMSLLDGIGSGQPLGALLGYRIERRLHELRLDRFILSLRAHAPLLAGKLTDHGEMPSPGAMTAIAANNVVDGITLLSADPKAVQVWLGTPPGTENPYLQAADWHPPSLAEWSAIVGVLDEARAAHDAVADLLLAEAVHHLVQGNTERAGAALDAAGPGDAAVVEPDVVRTPARGVAFTHRLLLLLPDPQLGQEWAVQAPRAAAEPRLEGWARALLGPAAQTVLQVAPDGTRITLDRAGLCALDVVYDSDGPGTLESRIRAAIPGLGPAPLAEARDPGWPADLRPYAETLELARSLRRLLAGARMAPPDAFARPSDKVTRTIVDLAGVQTRVENAAAALGLAEGDLAAALAQSPPDENALRSAAVALGAFGIPATAALATATGDPLRALAQAVDAEARRRQAAAQEILGKQFDKQVALDAGRAVFGEPFWILPPVAPGAVADLFSGALGLLTPGAAHIRRFLRDVATVRQGVACYAETLLFGDALRIQRPLRIAQLAEPGTPGVARWIALPFDPNAPSPDKPVTSIIVDAPSSVGGGDTVAGLVLDEWVEIAPRRVLVGPPGDQATVEARAVTGLAVNAVTPASRAPQAILLAVSPDGQRWSSASLADALEETLELAQLRAVNLDRALWAGRILPALQEQSWSLQGEKTLDPWRFAPDLGTRALLPYVKD